MQVTGSSPADVSKENASSEANFDASLRVVPRSANIGSVRFSQPPTRGRFCVGPVLRGGLSPLDFSKKTPDVQVYYGRNEDQRR